MNMAPATAAYLSVFTIAVSVVVVILLNKGLRRLKQYRRDGWRLGSEPVGDGRANPS